MPFHPDRRQLMTGFGASLGTALITAGLANTGLSGMARAAPVGETTGQTMIDRARRLLAALDDTGQESARFAFDSPTRQRWNFMGFFSAKPGLPMDQMTLPQREATLDLLTTGLSEAGMQKAENIMVLQEVLRERGGLPSQNRDKFSIAIFGEPGADAPWGWRFEGHHLTLSYTLNGADIVAVTPSSFSSNPNEVDSGPYAGLVALDGEQRLARSLYGDLNGTNRDRALIQERAFGNILTRAGSENRLQSAPRQGVPLGDLTVSQQQLARRLIETYAVDHLPPPLAAIQQARLDAEDMATMTFGWAGSDRVGETLYYRLHGDFTLIEFASLTGQPQHLHTIRHDLQHNLGQHVV